MGNPSPKNSKIRTLNDLSANNVTSSNDSGGEANGGRTTGTTGGATRSRLTGSVMKEANDQKQRTTASLPTFTSSRGGHLRVCTVPILPSADAAKALLDRVCQEFEPIMKRRGYYAKIRSVSEMCCCFDGLDFDPFTKQRTKARRKRIMSANVWGYNQTTRYGSNKWHTIHLRLRHPNSHDRLLCYEDVAGTMAHELAHCDIGPHNDAFQKLMDDILEEHMELQFKGAFTTFNGRGGTTNGSAGSAAFSGQGVALGRDGSSFSNPRNPGYKLGGDDKFTKWLTPGEAACIAAEARRRAQMVRGRGDHCCQPCTITIDGDTDDDQENDSNEQVEGKETATLPAQRKRVAGDDERKQPAKQRVQKVASEKTAAGHNLKTKGSQKSETIIDLTSDDGVEFKPTAKAGDAAWACRQCTFLNQSFAMSCSICCMHRAF